MRGAPTSSVGNGGERAVAGQPSPWPSRPHEPIHSQLDFSLCHPRGSGLNQTAFDPIVAICLPFSKIMNSPRRSFIPDRQRHGCRDPAKLYLEDLKSRDVQDPQERSPLPVGLVQGFVHAAEYPAEEAFISGLGQSLYGKVCLRGSEGTWLFPTCCVLTAARPTAQILNLPLPVSP